MKNKELAVLVLSCDAYKDLWAPYMQLFHKYWKDSQLNFYFCSDTLKAEDPSFTDIPVGKPVEWSARLLYAVERIKEPYVLLLLDDAIIKSASAKIGDNKKVLDEVLTDIQTEKHFIKGLRKNVQVKESQLQDLTKSYEQLNKELEKEKKRLLKHYEARLLDRFNDESRKNLLLKIMS